MCGITGIFSPQGFDAQQAPSLVRRMTDTLTHRGPDDSDVWLDAEAGIALGHRRLSILDLSPLGRQPMHSACGRYVIVYNGEVYNHLDLREELRPLGHEFKGHSDTETILAAVAQWGLEQALERFVGMFAIALWDRRERTLCLVRDRMGIKPLYYGQSGNRWVFGSELKALRAHGDFQGQINRDALSLFFRYGYIPAPHSIYTGTRKVLPGEVIRIRHDGKNASLWWDTRAVWEKGAESPFTDEAACIEGLDTVLRDAVQQRMLSDVPLGAFLSGGIDSSTVTALMQAQSMDKVKTYSIGFSSKNYNEAEHAKAIAEHLGTEHTELYVTPREMLDTVPDLPTYWDEPFADSSQIPTLILSRLTRQHVTVSLSGDGGDELFSGYSRYFWTQRVWNALKSIPLPLRRTGAAAAGLVPRSTFKAMGSLGQKLCWRLDALKANDLPELYRYFFSHLHDVDRFVPGSHAPTTAMDSAAPDSDLWRWMSNVDLQCYLPDDILTKVDRASMAASLEARVPLLDHRVVEFASRVPTSMKVRDGEGKWLLKQVLYQRVPQRLVDRPKMGFGVPIQQWLNQDLKQWADDTLNIETIRRQGFINADEVERMWRDFRNGESHYCHRLWDVLMFQSWLNTQGGA